MTKILVVDEDKKFLSFIKTTLHRLERAKVKTFHSAEQALRHLSSHSYDVIISDSTIGEMDGITFLKKIRLLQPSTVRILVSSICGRDILYGAINEARVHRYVEKPCHDDAVCRIVAETLREREQVGIA